MSRNKYSVQTIRAGAYPRPLKESQCRGMNGVGTVEPRPSGNGGHTLTPRDVAAKRDARRVRSTKHLPKRAR